MWVVSELRRRNVFRMAVLYVVAAWAVMQAAEVLIGLANLPDWIGPTLLVVLAVGFPIALVFSWLFEITPEGLALEKEVPAGQSITHVTGRRMDFVIIAILSAGLLLFAYDKWWIGPPPERSIAVLPFENMSADPEQEYFSDGISEEILNLLSQIKPLKVMARTSSFAFKGKYDSIAAIAQQLNVRHILEGSVRRSGDQVRITAQLIDAADGSHRWSQTYDRELTATNLFRIQADIARSIANQLRMTLTGDDEQQLTNVPTENTEAYAAYLLGRNRLTDRKVTELADAVEQFARAVELDPEFAGAYSGLVDACYLYDAYSGGSINANCPPSAAEREQLARKAVQLDPKSGEAWISLGSAIESQAGDSPKGMPKVREAIAAYEHGLDLNPNLSQGYQWYGMALVNHIFLYPNPPSGWIEAWQAGVWQNVIEKGLSVDPLSIPLHFLLAIYPNGARSKEEASLHGRRIVEIAPDSPRGYEILGEQAWRLYGRIDESIRLESKALKIDPQQRDFSIAIARAYSTLGDPEMALAYFDLAEGLIAPHSQSDMQELFVERSIVRLVSRKDNAPETAELPTHLSGGKKYYSLDNEISRHKGFELGIFADLAARRPAAALERIKEFAPKCFEVLDIEWRYHYCPKELIRVYQELGYQLEAKDLANAKVQYAKLWADGVPANRYRGAYASVLAAAGEAEKALDVLEEMVLSGYRGDYRYLLRFVLYYDVAFDVVRENNRFQALIATIEDDMAQQLENVREMQRRGEVPTLEEVKALIASRQEAR